MATLVGKTFPDITVKAIDEMGDSFMINLLPKLKEKRGEYGCATAAKSMVAFQGELLAYSND